MLIRHYARSLFSALIIAALIGTSTRFAHAQASSACIASFDEGEKLVKEHRLIEASEKYRACTESSCPASMQSMCGKSYADIEARIPTVVLEARAGTTFLGEVAVTLDGKSFAAKLDGTASRVDPGAHTFVFTARGQSVTVKTVVVEGKSGQSVSASFAAEEEAKSTPPDAKATAETQADAASAKADASPRAKVASTAGSLRWVGLGTAGSGLVLGVTGTVVAAGGASRFNDANDKCGALPSGHPDCQPSGTLDTAKAEGRSQRTLGLVLGGAGAALLITGIVLFAIAPSASAKTTATGVTSLAISPTGFALAGTF